MRRRFGLKKRDIAELESRVPRSDQTAESMNAPVYHGSIEEIEERHGPPWLRRRRREQRLARGE